MLTQFPGQMVFFFSRAIIEHLRTLSMESTTVGHERTEMTYNRSLKIWFLHQIITKNSVAAFLLHSYSGFFILSLWIKGRDWKGFWYFYLAYSIYILWNQLAEPGVRVGPCFYDADTLDSCFFVSVLKFYLFFKVILCDTVLRKCFFIVTKHVVTSELLSPAICCHWYLQCRHACFIQFFMFY